MSLLLFLMFLRVPPAVTEDGETKCALEALLAENEVRRVSQFARTIIHPQRLRSRASWMPRPLTFPIYPGEPSTLFMVQYLSIPAGCLQWPWSPVHPLLHI